MERRDVIRTGTGFKTILKKCRRGFTHGTRIDKKAILVVAVGGRGTTIFQTLSSLLR
jgi:hypothetical protein